MRNILLDDYFKIERRTKFRNGFSNGRCHFEIVILDLIDAEWNGLHPHITKIPWFIRKKKNQILKSNFPNIKRNRFLGFSGGFGDTGVTLKLLTKENERFSHQIEVQLF